MKKSLEQQKCMENQNRIYSLGNEKANRLEIAEEINVKVIMQSQSINYYKGGKVNVVMI